MSATPSTGLYDTPHGPIIQDADFITLEEHAAFFAALPTMIRKLKSVPLESAPDAAFGGAEVPRLPLTARGGATVGAKLPHEAATALPAALQPLAARVAARVAAQCPGWAATQADVLVVPPGTGAGLFCDATAAAHAAHGPIAVLTVAGSLSWTVSANVPVAELVESAASDADVDVDSSTGNNDDDAAGAAGAAPSTSPAAAAAVAALVAASMQERVLTAPARSLLLIPPSVRRHAVFQAEPVMSTAMLSAPATSRAFAAPPSLSGSDDVTETKSADADAELATEQAADTTAQESLVMPLLPLGQRTVNGRPARTTPSAAVCAAAAAAEAAAVILGQDCAVGPASRVVGPALKRAMSVIVVLRCCPALRAPPAPEALAANALLLPRTLQTKLRALTVDFEDAVRAAAVNNKCTDVPGTHDNTSTASATATAPEHSAIPAPLSGQTAAEVVAASFGPFKEASASHQRRAAALAADVTAWARAEAAALADAAAAAAATDAAGAVTAERGAGALPGELTLRASATAGRVPSKLLAPAAAAAAAAGIDAAGAGADAGAARGPDGALVTVSTLSDSAAAAFERQHVHAVYDHIAEHFSGTRHQAWPRVDDFVRTLPTGALVADVGCGNGKYMGAPHAIFVGSDASRELLRICALSRGFSVVESDILAPGLRPRAWDAVLCIAVLHHVATPARRARAVEALARLLRPGGRALVTVWAREQEATSKRRFEAADVWVGWKTPAHAKKDRAGLPVVPKGQKTKPAPAGAAAASAVAATADGKGRGQAVQYGATGDNGSTLEIVDATAEVKPELEATAATSSAQAETNAARPDAAQPEVLQPQAHRYYHVFSEGELEGLVAEVAAARRARRTALGLPARATDATRVALPVNPAAAAGPTAVGGSVSAEPQSAKRLLGAAPYTPYAPAVTQRLSAPVAVSADAAESDKCAALAAADAEDVWVEDLFYDRGNWCVVIRKEG